MLGDAVHGWHRFEQFEKQVKSQDHHEHVGMMLPIISILTVVILVPAVLGWFWLGASLGPRVPEGVERVLSGLWFGLMLIFMLSKQFWYLSIFLILTLASALTILWKKHGKSQLQIIRIIKLSAVVFLAVFTILLCFLMIYPLYRFEVAKHRVHLLKPTMIEGDVLSTLGLSDLYTHGRGSGPLSHYVSGFRFHYGHHLRLIYSNRLLQKVELDDQVWTP